MNKVIEADFLLRGTNADFSWPHSIGGSGRKERRRILIVDNDPNTTHLVKVLLEKTGHYLVLEEHDATKAHQSSEFSADLILLDVVMPDTDGGEVAAQIEADPELHNTPIVFLTGLVTRAEAKSGLNIQGHPFLAKPVSIPELINAIEQHLPVWAACHVSL